ncbi:hypothetical protein C8R44DRAFT_869472 [Mycena epipterygia]|nr:hypothetical protein C8R44DRAFT_869472 [Mycena epipterygia]
MASLTLTYGPLLFGGAAALILSGIVSVQCLIYFKSYSQRGIKKATVLVVWVLDVLQSAFILASLCHYFVTHFGDTSVLAVIPWSVASLLGPVPDQDGVSLNDMSFYAGHSSLDRAFILRPDNPPMSVATFLPISKGSARSANSSASGKNWVITSPVVLFATHQLLAGLVTSIQLLSIPHWTAFIKLDSVTKSRTQFMFTMGLTISAGTDIGIAICLCYYLRKIRRLSSSSIMKGVFNTLTIYTIENGLFMSITTIATLVCELREMHSGDQGIHFDPSVHLANYYPQFPHRAPAMSQTKAPLTAPAPIHDYHPLFKMHQMPSPTSKRATKQERALLSLTLSDPMDEKAKENTPPEAQPWPNHIADVIPAPGSEEEVLPGLVQCAAHVPGGHSIFSLVGGLARFWDPFAVQIFRTLVYPSSPWITCSVHSTRSTRARPWQT